MGLRSNYGRSPPRRCARRGGALDVLDIPTPAGAIRPGVVSADAGRVAAEALQLGARLCAAGELDGLVTAPIHKTALHAAGLRVEGQTELLGEMWGAAATECW